jgi:hypothetical protein
LSRTAKIKKRIDKNNSSLKFWKNKSRRSGRIDADQLAKGNKREALLVAENRAMGHP